MLTPAVPPFDLGRGRRGARAVAVVLVAVLVLLALLVGAPTPSGTAPDAAPWRWLERPAPSRTAIGPIALDGDLAEVAAALGPAAGHELDLGGTGYRWDLEGGAVLFVIADEADTVVGVDLTVPAGSAVRATLDGGLVAGRSTVGDVRRRWGPPDAVGAGLDDFALRYVTCIGPAPIVLKLDSTDRGAGDAARVEHVLVAYADEAPGTSGCTWTSGTETALAQRRTP